MANNKVEPQKENEINVLSDSVPCEARQETILAVLRQRYFFNFRFSPSRSTRSG